MRWEHGEQGGEREERTAEWEGLISHDKEFGFLNMGGRFGRVLNTEVMRSDPCFKTILAPRDRYQTAHGNLIHIS